MSQDQLIEERKPKRRERKGAKELLRLGIKVWNYRKDRIPPVEERALRIANEGLDQALKNRQTTASLLDKKVRILDDALRNSGGSYYHKKKLGRKCRNAFGRSHSNIGNTKFLCSAIYYTD